MRRATLFALLDVIPLYNQLHNSTKIFSARLFQR
jgi:hypothetical protein